VDRARAKEFVNKYMQEFSGVARYMQEMKDSLHRDGYVKTIFGRRRQLPEAFSGMPQLISQAERMAINMPIQGTAADLIKLSMVKIHELLHQEKVEENVKLLLQVHDELLFEVKDKLVNEWSEKIKTIMENTHKLEVPLIVDVKYGHNWAETQPL
jgi:DNA polymerase-1